MRQRVHALEAFLADIYSEGACFSDGLIPRRLVTTSPHFRREAVGIAEQNGARITVSGIDIVRDEGRSAPGPRGQCPHSFGRVVRHREPSGDDPEFRLLVLSVSRSPGRRVPQSTAARPSPLRARWRCMTPIGGRSDAGRSQRGLF